MIEAISINQIRKKSTPNLHKFGNSLANEDNKLEAGLILKENSSVLSFADSDPQIVTYLSKKPEKIHIVARSWHQVCLSMLRVEALKDLNYEEYHKFIGLETCSAAERAKLFDKVTFESPDVFYYIRKLMKSSDFRSPIYWGKWESETKWHSKVLRFLGLENCITHKKTSFPFIISLFIYSLFLDLLYFVKPQLFPQINDRKSFFQVYRTLLSQIQQSGEKEAIYDQLLLNGDCSTSALTNKCNEGIFKIAKSHLNSCKISYSVNDIYSELQKLPEHEFDYIFTSHSLGYLSPSQRTACHRLLADCLKSEGRVVNRYFRYTPEPFERQTLEVDPMFSTSSAYNETFHGHCIDVLKHSGQMIEEKPENYARMTVIGELTLC